MSGPSSGRYGEKPCPAPYKLSWRARRTRKLYFVRRPPCWSALHLSFALLFFFSTRTREMAPNVPDKGSPSCRGVSDQKVFCSASADPPLPSSSRARQMRLPTSYKPALTHRSNPMPPRPRNLLMSTPVHPPSPDAVARAAISPLHPPSSPSRRRHRPTADPSPGRPKLPFFPSAPRSSTDAAAGPREPSPTRSAASQPPPSTAAATEARVSLWAELKDIRRRSRTPATPALTT